MLVDANVFKGYFQVEIGKTHDLRGCPRSLMSSITSDSPVYHDEGGRIEHEWRSVVDPEWFDVWLAASLQSGIVQYLPLTHDVSIEKRLKSLGFPSGRDVVYVRAGMTVVSRLAHCVLYTEDLDFYNPKLKSSNAATRLKVLQASSRLVRNPAPCSWRGF